MAAAAAQRPRKQIGTVSELLGGTMDFFLGRVGNVAGQRGVVQDDGNGGGRKSAALGDIADGDRDRLRAFAGGIGFAAGFRRRGTSRRLRIGGFHGLLELRPLDGGHYRTMNRVSSIGVFFVVLLALLLVRAASAQATAPAKTKTPDRELPAAHDPQKLFAAGETALRAGPLDEAERACRAG